MTDPQKSGDDREMMTLRVLGIFFCVMGVLVLIATYEALGNRAAMVVNLLAGLTLAAVGLGMLLVSRRMSQNRSDQ